FVGHAAPQIMMGKKSGLDNIEIWCRKLGIELDEEKAMDVLAAVKLKSHDLKRVLTEKEFKKIVLYVENEK
ncbi:MAG: Pyruvate carboxyltransferase, partial [Thermodesulfobacteriota bacterium]|nr:Pyruvate carboxyltransferase [Thermodesulfobacteriota bacterium]